LSPRSASRDLFDMAAVNADVAQGTVIKSSQLRDGMLRQ